jgi:iron complex outermembrane receptor protein
MESFRATPMPVGLRAVCGDRGAVPCSSSIRIRPVCAIGRVFGDAAADQRHASRQAPAPAATRRAEPPGHTRAAATCDAGRPPPRSNLAGLSPDQQRYQLPQTAEGITAKRIEQTVNIVDSEDAVKYLPSLLLRKRNAGDNRTVLASRVWGLNSSAAR